MSCSFTKRILLTLACAWPFLTSAWAAQPPAEELLPAAGAPTKEELADAAKWIDRLDWPDLRGKAYVELTFGRATQNSKLIDGPKMRGFLLAEDEKSWTVFCDGTAAGHRFFFEPDVWPLATARYEKPKPDAPTDSKTSIRLVQLPQIVDDVVGPRRRETQQGDPFAHMGEKVTEQTALFLLARCCVRQGRPHLAEQLENSVMRLAAGSDLVHSPARGFRQKLESDVSTLFMWKAVVDFGDLALARPQLLTEFEQIVRLFPESKHVERATACAAQLRTMVREDEAHAAAARPLEKMTPEEQVREWVFRLRDQHGVQESQPGACDIFSDDYGGRVPKSPAQHLVELNFAAVPALIEALNDPRLTRSITFGRDFRFSHRVLTVGECAGDILTRIAGKRFSNAQMRDGSPWADQSVQEWWTGIQAKGEKDRGALGK